MAYSAKVGSFNIDTTKTAGQTQQITGVGFQPKIVLFWWSGSTETEDGVAGGNINIGFGAAISDTSRFSIVGLSEDAQATADTCNNQETTSCIKTFVDGDTTAVDGVMDFSSMDAGGFTLIVDDQFANAYRISYLALGGDDLTNVYIGNKQSPNATGNFDTTGLGFQPDALILASVFDASASGGSSSAYLLASLGMATGNSNQGVISLISYDAVPTTDTGAYGYNGEILGRLGSTATLSRRTTFVSFLADGFRLNVLEGTTQYYFHYIALKGGQYAVGDLTTRTDGNDITETPGFQPVALLFASANRALSTQDIGTANNRMSIGAATSTSNRAVQAVSDEDNLADSETAYANYDSAVYANIADDAIVGLMDIKSMPECQVTAIWFV